MFRQTACLSLALSLFAAFEATAHLSYTGRTFDIFTGIEQSQTIINTGTNALTKSYGWAAGTDADFARQDDQKYFRITLAVATEITISITSETPATFLPGFSLYSGLGHQGLDPLAPLDFDSAVSTVNYLASLGGTPKKGAFDALHTWKIGNGDAGSDLVTFTYIGNAADGTSANYGDEAGIDGDGVADGFVTKTFALPAGEYTLVVGGAKTSSVVEETNTFAFRTTVSVPEPSTALLLVGGLAAAGAIRRRSQAAA